MVFRSLLARPGQDALSPSASSSSSSSLSTTTLQRYVALLQENLTTSHHSVDNDNDFLTERDIEQIERILTMSDDQLRTILERVLDRQEQTNLARNFQRVSFGTSTSSTSATSASPRDDDNVDHQDRERRRRERRERRHSSVADATTTTSTNGATTTSTTTNQAPQQQQTTRRRRHHHRKSKLPPPISESALASLPYARVLQRHRDAFQHDDSTCGICCERFMDESSVNTILTRLPCGHLYHIQCAVAWLTKSCTCPECRYELPTNDRKFEKRRVERMSRRQTVECDCHPQYKANRNHGHVCFFADPTKPLTDQVCAETVPTVAFDKPEWSCVVRKDNSNTATGNRRFAAASALRRVDSSCSETSESESYDSLNGSANQWFEHPW